MLSSDNEFVLPTLYFTQKTVVAEFFNYPDGTSGLAEMSVVSLLDPKSSAQLKVLKPEIVASSRKIRFGVGSSIGKMALPGAMLRMINLDLTGRFFELKHEALRMTIDLGWAAICSAGMSQHLKTASIAALPYVGTSGRALYICMGTDLGRSPFYSQRDSRPVPAQGLRAGLARVVDAGASSLSPAERARKGRFAIFCAASAAARAPKSRRT